MKKILFLLVGLLLISCNPEDTPNPKGKLDPNAMIVIKPAKGVQLRSTVSGLTALEVVQQANSIQFQSHYFDNNYYDNSKLMARQFDAVQKDFETPSLKMYGTDVLRLNGDYLRDFTNAFSVYIVYVDNFANVDTLAYIPDEVIATARPLIEQAYADENYTEVYRLFNEAYTFIPIE